MKKWFVAAMAVCLSAMMLIGLSLIHIWRDTLSSGRRSQTISIAK